MADEISAAQTAPSVWQRLWAWWRMSDVRGIELKSQRLSNRWLIITTVGYVVAFGVAGIAYLFHIHRPVWLDWTGGLGLPIIGLITAYHAMGRVYPN